MLMFAMSALSQKAVVHSFFDTETSTFSYVVVDKRTRECAVIDSVTGFDHVSGRTNTTSADKIISFINEHNYQVSWLLETHIHADHLSAAPYIKKNTGGIIGIGRHIVEVQKNFYHIFNSDDNFAFDGHDFDYLFHNNATITIGKLAGKVFYTPGHTPACVSYFIGDALFVGDTIFMPDTGTARCDFPGGNAHTLYRSIKQLLCLPTDTRVFVCHDYPPPGRLPECESTIARQRAANIHVRDGVSEEEFVRMRHERDKTLDMPVLLIPSIQVNMRAGRLPEVERNGARYIKIPIDTF